MRREPPPAALTWPVLPQYCPVLCCTAAVLSRTAPYCPQYKENLEARAKYSDQPEKFLESEVDLDEQVKSLLQVRAKLKVKLLAHVPRLHSRATGW